MEKVVVTNSQSFEIADIKLENDRLSIAFQTTSISELEEVFSNKNLISTIKIMSEGNEQIASYIGYTRFISIMKDGETLLTTVCMGKVDETQARIEELEEQIQVLNKIVAKLV